MSSLSRSATEIAYRPSVQDAINGEQHEADVMYPDYARQADQAGNPQAANLFREIAGDEKTHQQTFQKALTAS